MPDVVILSATRTPLGSFQGSFASVPAPRLGAVAIRGALQQANVPGHETSDVFMGNVLQAGVGQAPARQAALFAGLPTGTRCVTVNKVCGSGLESVIQAARAIKFKPATVNGTPVSLHVILEYHFGIY